MALHYRETIHRKFTESGFVRVFYPSTVSLTETFVSHVKTFVNECKHDAHISILHPVISTQVNLPSFAPVSWIKLNCFLFYCCILHSHRFTRVFRVATFGLFFISFFSLSPYNSWYRCTHSSVNVSNFSGKWMLLILRPANSSWQRTHLPRRRGDRLFQKKWLTSLPCFIREHCFWW